MWRMMGSAHVAHTPLSCGAYASYLPCVDGTYCKCMSSVVFVVRQLGCLYRPSHMAMAPMTYADVCRPSHMAMAPMTSFKDEPEAKDQQQEREEEVVEEEEEDPFTQCKGIPLYHFSVSWH